MALMTSSSVTSSLAPWNVVSRRSIRMARSLSALPRRALISARRSVSLRGRKSMVALLPDQKNPGRARARPPRSGPGRQLGEQQVHPAVETSVGVVHLEDLALADEVVAHF